jgi:AAA+ ATPase superfamily predicted ATPase
MFIGRKKELAKLNSMFTSDQFQFAVLYGRRRVGKTELLKEFMKDKTDIIFYTATESTKQMNLESFSSEIFGQDSELSAFQSFESALKHISSMASDKKVTLIIDEYPYLAQSSPEISSLLQKMIDLSWQHTNMMLILSGSSISFMEDEVLGGKSPLYGRRTAQFRLKPFTYFEAKGFLPEMPDEDFIQLFAITGGVAMYLKQMKADLTVEENIKQTLLSSDGTLFEEPVNLVKQELRDPFAYNSIIEAIAKGSNKPNEISMDAGIPSSSLSYYLKNLISLILKI